MLDIFLDGLLDTLKTLPFLFGAYLLLELFERRAEGRLANFLARLGPWGPLGGAVLGCVPQCGFSVAAANLYAGRLISPGTLLAVFLATSDEALPILLSQPGAMPQLALLLGVKLAAGTALGLLADLVLFRRRKAGPLQASQAAGQGCGCGHNHQGPLRGALAHTLHIFLFLLAVNLLLGYAIHFVGQDALSSLLLSGSIFQPLLAALLGFLPNCAASVLLTELYLAGSLSFGAAVAGLCTGAGLGMLVLFRTNRNLKENLALAGTLYGAAVITGTVSGLIFGG